MPRYDADYEIALWLRDGIVEAQIALLQGRVADARAILEALVPAVTARVP